MKKGVISVLNVLLLVVVSFVFFSCSNDDVYAPKPGEESEKTTIGLPVVYIDTENQEDITSRDYYINGIIRIEENLGSQAYNEFESEMRIKGRGNSTWGAPKKPYKIKFDKKTSLLGEPADKEWVLLANYKDKTMLRNETAFSMGRMSNLDYTPRSHFVELYLNGAYKGTYQLTEHLKIANNRVDVGEDGYLLEIDVRATADEPIFNVVHIPRPINIKDPNVAKGSEAYNYIVEYMQETDAVLFSDKFTDAVEGYAKYIDVESFVDWYLINEIAKNIDAIFYTSCYMNLARGGKLKMGPIWDFDIGYGKGIYNGVDNPEGFWIHTNVWWYSQLFRDPNFVQKVKERFYYFYGNRTEIYAGIFGNADYLKYSVIENNRVWRSLSYEQLSDNQISGLYQNELLDLINWLEIRFQWLNEQYSKM